MGYLSGFLNNIHPMIRPLICLGAVLGYYRFFKSWMFKQAPKISAQTRFSQRMPHSNATGLIELLLAASSHILFVCILLNCFDLSILGVGFQTTTFKNLVLGALLGLGLMSSSSLICRGVIEVLRLLVPHQVPKDNRNWLILARSGWMRHHLHALDAFPFRLGILITVVQIACEETVFRGIFIEYLRPLGVSSALVLSTLLFAVIQTFHMPSKVSMLFPVVGALTMGVAHSLLYLRYSESVPLILSHFISFAAAVL